MHDLLLIVLIVILAPAIPALVVGVVVGLPCFIIFALPRLAWLGAKRACR